MNALLEQGRTAILSKIPPQLKPVVDKIVAAGHKVMFSQKTQHLMIGQLKGAPRDQMDEVIGAGIAKLVGILYSESKRTAPMPALIPAAMVLLMDGLDFLEEAGAVTIDNQFVADCTKSTGSAIGQLFGATPDKLATLAQQAQTKQQQPAAPPQGAVPPAPPPGIVGQAMGGA